MKFAFSIRLSSYRIMIKRGITVQRLRKFDLAYANMSSISLEDANLSGISLAYANLNIVGIGVQLKIGKYRASLVGKYISVGCVTRRIKEAMRGSIEDYSKAHSEAAAYRDAVQRTIKAAFAMRKAARVKV